MSDAPTNRTMSEMDWDNPSNYAPPHDLCLQCRHFVCKHDGYPGRLQSGAQCAVMEMVPVTATHNEIRRCTCTQKARPRG